MSTRNTTEVLTGLVVLAVAGGFLGYALAHSGQSRISRGYTLLARFDNVAGLAIGAPVRLAGVKVGTVEAEDVDPKTYLANVRMTIRDGIALPRDSSVTVASEGLLGGEYLAIDPGADERTLQPGQAITITQGAVSLQDLLGKFIFSATSMVSNLGKAGGAAAKGTPQGTPPPPGAPAPAASPGAAPAPPPAGPK